MGFPLSDAEVVTSSQVPVVPLWSATNPFRTYGWLLFALLVFGLTGNHWITRVLGWGPIAAFGRASLCLYLLHFNTWIALHEYHVPERLHVEAFDPWFSYLVMLTFAYAAFRLVEKPAQHFLLTRYVYKSAPPVQASAPLG